MSSSDLDAAAAAAQQAHAAYQKIINKLKEENKEMKIKLKKLEATVTKLQKEKKDRKQQEHNVNQLEQVKEFLATSGGLSRATLFNDQWHANYPAAANQLFGFASWQDCKDHLIQKEFFPQHEDLTPLVPQVTWSPQKKQFQLSSATSDTRSRSELEQALCIRMCHRMAWSSARAGILFGAHGRTVTAWRQRWGPNWGISGDSVKVHQSTPMIPAGAAGGGKKRKKNPNATTTDDEQPHEEEHPDLDNPLLPTIQQQQQHQIQQQPDYLNPDFLQMTNTLAQIGGKRPRSRAI